MSRECLVLGSFRDAASARGHDWEAITCPREGMGCVDKDTCPLYSIGYEAVRGIASRNETITIPDIISQPAEPFKPVEAFNARNGE